MTISGPNVARLPILMNIVVISWSDCWESETDLENPYESLKRVLDFHKILDVIVVTTDILQPRFD